MTALRQAVLTGVSASALMATLLVGSPGLAAEDYPVRSITLIVPFPPGGGVDTMGTKSPRPGERKLHDGAG